MKHIKGICVIFGITLAGELLNQAIPLPVPAGVYGLFLLLLCLCSGVIRLDTVEGPGGFLLETMPLMFIPVSVGLIDSYDQVKSVFVPLLAIVVVSTVVVMIVTGKSAEFIMRKTDKGRE